MAIARFETGKWYRYTGHRRESFWNNHGLMDYVLDNKPHLCTQGRGTSASFKEDARVEIRGMWNWDEGYNLWEEVSPFDNDLVELEFYPRCFDKLA